MLAKSNLNSIGTLLSQALTHMKINHEEFITVLKEKGKYEKTKENLRNVNEKFREKLKTRNQTVLIQGLKKIASLWMIYTSSDFNWLKNLSAHFFCLCIK